MTGAALIYGIMSYHCGVKDRAQKTRAANQKAFRAIGENTRLKTELAISEQRAETNARAIELLNDELEAANLIPNNASSMPYCWQKTPQTPTSNSPRT